MPVERVSISELRDDYILCRTLGHSWDDNPTGEVNSDWEDYSIGYLTLRCTRCGTERFDYIGNDLSVAYRYYRYPAQYQSIPGEGTRPNLRGEMLKRSLLIHGLQAQRSERRNGRR